MLLQIRVFEIIPLQTKVFIGVGVGGCYIGSHLSVSLSKCLVSATVYNLGMCMKEYIYVWTISKWELVFIWRIVLVEINKSIWLISQFYRCSYAKL